MSQLPSLGWNIDEGSSDIAGDQVRIYPFIVPTNQKAALTYPGVPQEGDAHPDLGGSPHFLVCTGRSVRAFGRIPDHSEVIAEYRYDPLRQTKSGTFTKERVVIQQVFETFILAAGAPPGTPRQRRQEIVDFVVTENRRIRQRRVRFQQYGPAEENAIDAQNGSIHIFGGLPMLFEAGNVTPVGPRLWETTYSWYSDPGTPEIKVSKIVNGQPVPAGNPIITGPVGQQSGLYYPPPSSSALPLVVPGAPGGLFARSPFHEVKAVIDPVVEPYFIQVFPYKSDPTGWQSLPGSPQP